MEASPLGNEGRGLKQQPDNAMAHWHEHRPSATRGVD